MRPFSIYLHIPFCLQRCPYCDFNTYAVTNVPEREYVSALLAELDYRASLEEWRGRELRSIYFGGGTPSLFGPESVEKIVSVIFRTFEVYSLAEISLEANPGTVSGDKLLAFREAGINRLSLGAQSFKDETLKTLGRIHCAGQVESAISDARGAGFKNLSLDLIYGVPGQSLGDWKSDLNTAIRFAPEHISAYGLTIEKGTPFYESCKNGLMRLPSEGAVMKMMKAADSLLINAGFRRYEISNYARAGREAKHNLTYWDCGDYLGLGAGAHSYAAAALPVPDDFGFRWANYARPEQYMAEAVARGRAESWSEKLEIGEAMFEYFFLGLRKIEGVSLGVFAERFGASVNDVYPSAIEMLVQQKFVSVKDDQLALTERGLMLADSVFEFFAADQSRTPADRKLAGKTRPEKSLMLPV